LAQEKKQLYSIVIAIQNDQRIRRIDIQAKGEP